MPAGYAMAKCRDTRFVGLFIQEKRNMTLEWNHVYVTNNALENNLRYEKQNHVEKFSKLEEMYSAKHVYLIHSPMTIGQVEMFSSDRNLP
jgi:hypothetical protein